MFDFKYFLNGKNKNVNKNKVLIIIIIIIIIVIIIIINNNSNNNNNNEKLKTAKLALMTFTKLREGKTVHLQMDKVTALTYLVKMGGTKSSELNRIAQACGNF